MEKFDGIYFMPFFDIFSVSYLHDATFKIAVSIARDVVGHCSSFDQ
jgi:hypothetical protein